MKLHYVTKFTCLLLGLSFASVTYSAIDISWNNNTQGNLTDSDGSTLLFGTSSDGSTADFAQLIFAGANGIIDALDLSSSDGVSGDDVVIGVAHIGFNMGFSPTAGNINAVTSYSLNVDDVIYARFFNAPSPNYPSELVPTAINVGTATHYGNSSSYTITQGNFDSSIATYVIDATSTNIAIPEPTTIAILLMGIAGIFGFRKHLRK